MAPRIPTSLRTVCRPTLPLASGRVTSEVVAAGPSRLPYTRGVSSTGPSKTARTGGQTSPSGPALRASTASANKLPPSQSTAGPTTARGDKKAQAGVIPPLPRPLGVPKPPTTKTKTWTEKKEEMLSEERHKAKRKELIKEATQGYFHDYNRARSANGGKLYMAPPVLIREDRALYFPDISGKSLLGETAHTTDLLKGKITILNIITTKISEEHVQSYTVPLLSNWPPSAQSASNPAELPPKGLFQHVQINHQENPLKSMLLSFFLSSLKRSVPQEGWGKYLVSGGEWSHFDIEGPLGLENKLVGYVFLIDQNIKVRWAACGPGSEKEVQDLRTATAVLMRRAMESIGQ